MRGMVRFNHNNNNHQVELTESSHQCQWWSDQAIMKRFTHSPRLDKEVGISSWSWDTETQIVPKVRVINCLRRVLSSQGLGLGHRGVFWSRE